MVYIAAPFFDDFQVAIVEKIKNVLLEQGISFFSPKDELDIVEGKNFTFEERKKVFFGNINGMSGSNFAIAVIDDFDKGVLWEMGFLFSKNIPIIVYTNFEDRGLNVMLQCSVSEFVRGIDELKKVLKSGKYF